MNNKEAVLISPHQLYKHNELIKKDRVHYLIEDPLYFGDLKSGITKFHKLKIVLHRASMKRYKDEILKDFDCKYVNYSHVKDFKNLFKILQEDKISKIIFYDPTDYLLEKRLRKFAADFEIELAMHDSPNFLTPKNKLEEYFNEQKRPFFHANFYKWQRLRLNILIDSGGQPEGGKWSFDEDNRKKLPKGLKPENPKFYGDNAYVSEAIEYVNKNFSDYYGFELTNDVSNLTEEKSYFIYPTNHTEAEEWLDEFLKERFNEFGIYEDALHSDFVFINHSVLTPMMNIGLLNPDLLIDKTLEYAKTNDIPLNSLEGFIRQIIGWREFMRLTYLKIGTEQRNSNFFNHKNKLTEKFYNSTTEIKPIDDVIYNLNKFAYSHHIPRLMIMGNIMLILELDPKEIYKWFMEMYIDAYDWVMVPNVYGMSQFADGGKVVTKPYFSSSNYILKMSNYKGTESKFNGTDWKEVWDGLFWRFVKKHKDFLKNNARMGFIVNMLNKGDKEEKIELADKYIDSVVDKKA